MSCTGGIGREEKEACGERVNAIGYHYRQVLL